MQQLSGHDHVVQVQMDTAWVDQPVRLAGLRQLVVRTSRGLQHLHAPALEVLRVDRHDLEHIPDWPEGPLKTLRLRNGPLCSLRGIERFRQLQELDVQDNAITSWPRGLDIRQLSVQDNPARTVPRQAVSPDATRLSLRGMALRKLPAHLKRCTALRELDLSGSPVAELPDWLPTLTRLRKLILSGCALKAVPPVLLQCPELTQVVLTGSPIQDQRQDLEAAVNAPLDWRDAWFQLLRGQPVPDIAAQAAWLARPSTFDAPFQTLGVHGNTNLPKDELKRRLAAQNVQVVPMNRADVLLLGGSRTPFQHPRIGLESQLTDWLMAREGRPTLMVGDLTVDEIRDLLLGSPADVLKALQVMADAGVPKAMLTDVHAITAVHPHPPCRDAARKLFRRWAPGPLRASLGQLRLWGITDRSVSDRLRELRASDLDINRLTALPDTFEHPLQRVNVDNNPLARWPPTLCAEVIQAHNTALQHPRWPTRCGACTPWWSSAPCASGPGWTPWPRPLGYTASG